MSYFAGHDRPLDLPIQELLFTSKVQERVSGKGFAGGNPRGGSGVIAFPSLARTRELQLVELTGEVVRAFML